MQNIEFKLKAREAIQKQGKPVFHTTLFYLAIQYVFNLFIVKLYGYDVYLTKVANAMARGNIDNLPELPVPGIGAVVLIIAINLFMVIVNVGYSICMLRASRNESFKAKALLDGFEFLLRSFAIEAIRFFLIFVGMLLFIVPGFVMAYRYRLAIYVMFDNPDKGAIWCLRESARIMKGRKKSLFSLEISFLPLLLLNELVAMLLLPILEVWVKPYFEMAHTVFYNEATGFLPQEPIEESDV